MGQRYEKEQSTRFLAAWLVLTLVGVLHSVSSEAAKYSFASASPDSRCWPAMRWTGDVRVAGTCSRRALGLAAAAALLAMPARVAGGAAAARVGGRGSVLAGRGARRWPPRRCCFSRAAGTAAQMRALAFATLVRHDAWWAQVSCRRWCPTPIRRRSRASWPACRRGRCRSRIWASTTRSTPSPAGCAAPIEILDPSELRGLGGRASGGPRDDGGAQPGARGRPPPPAVRPPPKAVLNIRHRSAALGCSCGAGRRYSWRVRELR